MLETAGSINQPIEKSLDFPYDYYPAPDFPVQSFPSVASPYFNISISKPFISSTLLKISICSS